MGNVSTTIILYITISLINHLRVVFIDFPSDDLLLLAMAAIDLDRLPGPETRLMTWAMSSLMLTV